MENILIVKKGALGDVVRTSYFAGALRRKYGTNLCLSWLTSAEAQPLLKYNPNINLLTDNVHDLRDQMFDRIFSLDDERNILQEVGTLRTTKLSGAYLDPSGQATYSADSAEWFDMGLLSRLGKDKADQLKRANKRSHSEIFSNIFDVSNVSPEFFDKNQHKVSASRDRSTEGRLIGINPFAGGRWRSKQLRKDELQRLIQRLLNEALCEQIHMFGSGSDYESNCRLANHFADARIISIHTDSSVLDLAVAVSSVDLMITSDSLALHLAVAQRVPIVAFFAPTSASEIDLFGRGIKVTSTSPDYCSYRSDADNSSITANRLIDAVKELSAPKYGETELSVRANMP